jgi:hypothetical protein
MTFSDPDDTSDGGKTMPRNNLILWSLGATIVVLAGLCPSSIQAQPRVLDVPLYGQKTPQWCWAATTRMTVGYHGACLSQCQQANAAFGRTDCCDIPTPTTCIEPGLPAYKTWGYSASLTQEGTALTWEELTAQIDAGLPTNFIWRWKRGGGHIMVARGYETVDGEGQVYINDPWPVDQGNHQWITYKRYVSQPGDHTHGADFYDVNVIDPPLQPLELSSPKRFNVSPKVGSAPAMATFGNRLYLAFEQSDANLNVTSSVDGRNWKLPTTYDIKMGGTPAMAVLGDKLYIAFQADDPSSILYVTSSSNGTQWQVPATGFPDIQMRSAPAMATLGDRLYLAYQADDEGHQLYVTSSSDGASWDEPTPYNGIRIGGKPAMATWNGRLYIAFRANNGTNLLYVTSSEDGTNWTVPASPCPGILLSEDPSLTASSEGLYVALKAENGTNKLYVSSSTDGRTWRTPATGYPGILISSSPAIAAVRETLVVTFRKDPNDLYVTSTSADD